MEGFPGIQKKDMKYSSSRFQVPAAVNFPKLGRKKGHWYTANPPLCRPATGLCPVDYFGRTMVSNLLKNIEVGVVVVVVPGYRILGTRYADKMLSLPGHKVTEPDSLQILKGMK